MTTSAASAGSARPALVNQSDSLLARIAGVLTAPRRTFAALIAAPRAFDVLLLTTLVSAGVGAALLLTDVGQFALLDQWERTAIGLGRPVGEAEYAAMQRATTYGAAYAGVRAIVSGPVLALVLAGAVFAVFRARGTAVRYAQVLAITAHASVILCLQQVIVTPMHYAGETLASPSSLSLLLPMMDDGSPIARFFGLIDLFVVWWLMVVASGVALLYRQPARRVILALLATYVGLGLTLALTMAVLGGIR